MLKDTARGGFWVGVGMLVLGIGDATLNAFQFAEAAEFFTAGVALIAASMSAQFGKGKDDEK
jgi:hypothetical protein